MNERIKELERQAVEETNKIVYHEDYPQWNSTFHQKFAELIVLDVLDEVLKAMDDGMDVYDTVTEHFGVES